MASEERHGVCKHWHLWPLRGRPRRLPRRQICAVAVLGADAEQFLAAQALQHVRLERERGQRCALTTILALLDKAQQAEDILEPEEPRHRRQDEAYDHDGRAIGEEIGVHTQRETRKQRHDLALLLAIEEVPSTDGAELVILRVLAREETRERCSGSEGPCGEARVWTPLRTREPSLVRSTAAPRQGFQPAILCGAA
jgi:hypothetical protein